MVFGETISQMTNKGGAKQILALPFGKSKMDDGKKAGRGKNPCYSNTRRLSPSALCLLLN